MVYDERHHFYGQVMRVIHETLQYPFSTSPEFGTTMQVAPGVYWLRMPLPMSLNHINLYLIEGRNAANLLCNKLTEDENFKGWFNTRDDLDRPFFSAAEAGLPILALHKFAQIDPLNLHLSFQNLVSEKKWLYHWHRSDLYQNTTF